jgi:hypothetical protein
MLDAQADKAGVQPFEASRDVLKAGGVAAGRGLEYQVPLLFRRPCGFYCKRQVIEAAEAERAGMVFKRR